MDWVLRRGCSFYYLQHKYSLWSPCRLPRTLCLIYLVLSVTFIVAVNRVLYLKHYPFAYYSQVLIEVIGTWKGDDLSFFYKWKRVETSSVELVNESDLSSDCAFLFLRYRWSSIYLTQFILLLIILDSVLNSRKMYEPANGFRPLYKEDRFNFVPLLIHFCFTLIHYSI